MSIKSPKIKHPLIELGTLPARFEGDGRYYQSRNGNWYPSITTFLKQAINEPGLDAWRERVGEEAADAARARGARRGTAVHQLLEGYLLGTPCDPRTVMPIHLDLFSQLRNLLEEHLGDVYLFETALYSDFWQLAGTPDLIALWDGILSIIDFKTASRRKRITHIQKHFLQTAGYKLLFDDTMKHDAQFKAIQLVILIANEDGPPPQVFVEPAAEYVQMFDRLWQEHHPAAAHLTHNGTNV